MGMKPKVHNYISIGQAILAAALFGMSAPFSKLLLIEIPPLMMSSLLYLGAGAGTLVIYNIKKVSKTEFAEAALSKQELPFIILMVLLDIAAPIALMLGLTMTTSSNAALLNNFEIAATSIIALVIFKEAIGKRLWLSIVFITIASIILSIDDFRNISFSAGSIFILLACVFWGLENNCTRKLSIKDPLQIIIIKGIGAGFGAFVIALLANQIVWKPIFISMALILGFFAYGMSIFFYVTAQRSLGAARTSAYYAIAPFIGVGISFIIFNQPITVSFLAASGIMILGTYFAIFEKHVHQHLHTCIEHDHRHNHSDEHHNHSHESIIHDQHTHLHVHEKIMHNHQHTPDIHHAHEH
jgi:drug/metabolite transporter (DMT)-like permease